MKPSLLDIMNRELVYLREGARPELALPHILRFGITAVPVLDEDHKPIGVVSLRDIVGRDGRPAEMTSPAHMVSSIATIEQAAEVLAKANVHHLVVVDKDGHAVGMVSSVDLLRAMLGMPVQHPPFSVKLP